MRLKFASLFIALATCGMHAHAEVVRCTDANGKVSYSDVACPDSTTHITAVRTEMASPGEQLDSNYDSVHSNAVRAPQSTSSVSTRVTTRTIVVRRVIVVEHPHVPEKVAATSAATTNTAAASPRAQAHAAAAHR